MLLGNGGGHEGLETGLADGIGAFAHFLSAAFAVLHHAAEEVGTSLLPVDAGEGLGQRGNDVVFHAVFAGRGVALNHQRLQPLDHHAAAHFDGAGDTNIGADRLGIHAKNAQTRGDGRRLRTAQEHGHADAVGRDAGHDAGLDVMRTSGFDELGGLLFGAGRGRVEV